jgi:hypothetical protein
MICMRVRMLPDESEYQALASVDRDRVESPEFAGQGVQASPGRCVIVRLRRGIRCRQEQPLPGRMLWLDSGLGASSEERREPPCV